MKTIIEERIKGIDYPYSFEVDSNTYKGITFNVVKTTVPDHAYQTFVLNEDTDVLDEVFVSENKSLAVWLNKLKSIKDVDEVVVLYG